MCDNESHVILATSGRGDVTQWYWLNVIIPHCHPITNYIFTQASVMHLSASVMMFMSRVLQTIANKQPC